MKPFIIFLIIVAIFVVVFVYCSFNHTPRHKLSDKQKEQILKNGVNHFTSNDAANIILNNQYLEGKESSFECWLGPLVWTYENTTEEKMEKDHERLIKKAKGAKGGYTVCLKIAITDKQLLDNARTRKSDNAIIFKTEKLEATIIEIKRWN